MEIRVGIIDDHPTTVLGVESLLAAQDGLNEGEDVDFMKSKIVTARFYAEHILVKVPGLRDAIVGGADSVCDMALDAF